MNRKLISIFIAVFSVIIAAEAIFLLLRFLPKHSPDNSTQTAGNVSHSDTIVTINDIQIPSYDFQSVVYIAAEDLLDFGFEVLTTEDTNSIALSYRKGADMNISGRYSDIPDNSKVRFFKGGFYLNKKNVQCYVTYNYHLIPAKTLKSVASLTEENNTLSFALGETSDKPDKTVVIQTASDTATAQWKDIDHTTRIIEGSTSAKNYRSPTNNTSKIIVLDPGHGKPSSQMSDAEKKSEGYSYNESNGQWGEWRHWKSGSSSIDCEGSGCVRTHTAGGSCWYPMGNGDRNTEPELNLNNALAAKKYLEEMGYTVRMTRTTNDENPSFSKRISYCYPNNDNTQKADALLYMCIHSNAGGGSGSAYISAGGEYDQKGIRTTYINDCNTLGAVVNEKIVSSTSLKKSGGGAINGLGALIAFNKSPVTCGYMEIGYYDNASDLNIIRNESDIIGKAIAEGIDEFINGSE